MNRVSLVALAVAVMALAVAAYTISVVSKQPTATKQPPAPVPNVTVNIVDSVTVDAPGTYTVKLGLVRNDAPVVVEFSASCAPTTRAYCTPNNTITFLIDGIYYGNPAVALLDKGDHVVDAIVYVYDNATKFNIFYKVLG